MDATQRVWGYTGATGMIQAFSAGYFLWDLMTGVLDRDVHGWGVVAHAASALAVSSLGFVGFFYSTSMLETARMLKCTDQTIAAFRQLLWLEFHTLRTLHTFS